jgi:membrane-bound metal-dependent hydrolase YbcI (DUF457 family)
MTPIGHTLTGLAIGYTAIPRDVPTKQKFGYLAVFSLFASLPDLPLPYRGHSSFEISHSLVTCTVGVMVIGSLLLWKYKGRFPFTPMMIFAGALCWFSHILLDSMYSWGIGTPFAWPLGKARLALPVPWLHIANKTDIFSLYNVRVAIFEILTFGPLLLLAVLFKQFLPRKVVANAGTSPS